MADPTDGELGTATNKPIPTWLKLRMAASKLVKPSSRSTPAEGHVIELSFNKTLKLDAPANEIAAI